MSVLYSDDFLARLEALARDKAPEYAANKPFPHIYFDDFLPLEAAEAALRDFPEPRQLNWQEFSNQNEKKLAFDVAEKLPTSIRDVLYFLNSRPMVQFLEVLTGIKGVIPDPYFVGGGLHQIKPGGHLEVHSDFNWHEQLQLDRRINVLVYLNKEWREEYGGHFELWNHDMTKAERKILPLFNRCAIFSTTDYSYHGHPTPLSCPPDRSRKSIATYYYSNGRPEEEISDSHTTNFRQRPDAPAAAEANGKSHGVKGFLTAVTPPFIVDAYKSLRK
ncbi:Rps23 Pro-64 3,4-dihydroxylase Tpa1-like proline 4-hydroxylase [Silvibacterium bohemicum]|uniref:Rps23 Pro-64 3,4-dihydroxylase Tpa1-like proline 4-hydroxylase n=1 Tax=Silvibacterium bohemicum TaxID=1577686 RepID=A0A841JUY8_9BACT|nr:2OG-Fe(II) oxygenase [Silvibacterium bohemicum]MBB6142811.1 Rps23 Pro-64 3,4-dihydroxylase Tpa1-like proline 4-hydroxylase [Silvibacterium bohemicum]